VGRTVIKKQVTHTGSDMGIIMVSPPKVQVLEGWSLMLKMVGALRGGVSWDLMGHDDHSEGTRVSLRKWLGSHRSGLFPERAGYHAQSFSLAV
jgi:hypothetical protein